MRTVDLSRVPREALEAELARRKRPRGQPPKLAPCPRCGKQLSSADRRKACPAHGAPE